MGKMNRFGGKYLRELYGNYISGFNFLNIVKHRYTLFKYNYLAFVLHNFLFFRKKVECIVSFTTIAVRFNEIETLIGSLLLQSVNPAEIIMWIDFDEVSLEKFRRKLTKIRNSGVTVRQIRDVGPHTKLVYALKEYPDLPIVTCDDDKIYPSYWLKDLFETYREHPECIVCHRAHLISFDNKGKIANYRDWESGDDVMGPSLLLFPTGVGGILYPPGSLDDQVTDEKLFMKLAPMADDVWFKAMSLLKKSEVVKTGHHSAYIPDIFYRADKKRLFDGNVLEGGNDVQIQQVFDYYNLYHVLWKEYEVLQPSSP